MQAMGEWRLEQKQSVRLENATADRPLRQRLVLYGKRFALPSWASPLLAGFEDMTVF